MQKIAGPVAVAFLTAGFFSCAHAATLMVPTANPIQIYEAIQAKEMTVVANSANLRETPADNGKILERLTKGTKVTVVETMPNKRDWAHVHVGDTWGYINLKLLK
jgi:uncharacterized protein YgiM (DUF1202 family)